eukprot:TRINITY_DN2406_c0_g1_i39.p1 TRINITY_DN2406_c0_g1~~TRINITY_DN2406_c0_g1_i39.p1  ORF type:complete len:141 (+),score=19.13 TRINITY_DN2406_c0_g1_i39:992-1414(+)
MEKENWCLVWIFQISKLLFIHSAPPFPSPPHCLFCTTTSPLTSQFNLCNETKGVGPAGLIERLYMVWEDYVQLMFQQTGYKFEAPMSTSTTITLKQLLSSLVSHHHHHCYLVDASKIVEGFCFQTTVVCLTKKSYTKNPF